MPVFHSHVKVYSNNEILNKNNWNAKIGTPPMSPKEIIGG